MDDRINVCLSCDKNYLQHAAVVIVSVLSNNPDDKFRIFLLLTEPLDYENNKKLDETLEKYPHAILQCIVIEISQISYSERVHVSKATFGRLCMEWALPTDVRKILYLDSDVVVLGRLRPLFDIDITGWLAAAANDPWHPVRQELGFSEPFKYINAGVMLINLEKWRAENLSARMLQFYEENQIELVHADQCAINALTVGRVLLVGLEWNYQVAMVRSRATTVGLDQKSFRLMADSPKIVHYSGSYKPWHYNNNVPFKVFYWKYLRLSAWNKYVPPDVSVVRKVNQIIKRSLLFILIASGIRSHRW